MSANPKKILQNIRKARNLELQNYKKILSPIQIDHEKKKTL